MDYPALLCLNLLKIRELMSGGGRLFRLGFDNSVCSREIGVLQHLSVCVSLAERHEQLARHTPFLCVLSLTPRHLASKEGGLFFWRGLRGSRLTMSLFSATCLLLPLCAARSTVTHLFKRLVCLCSLHSFR